MQKSINTAVVGGGQAGVATSYFLQQNQIAHVVLEKDSAFSEWYRRWDSFQMNTANWMNTLPGATDEFAAGASRDVLGMKADALRYFESTLAAVHPPIREHTEALSVKQAKHDIWDVVTPDTTYETSNVVICTGALRNPKVPSIAAQLPSSIFQLHSNEYRNPEQIKTRHVLVVGSGNSGVQICEDLAKSGRFDKLTFAVSGNLVVPLEIMGFSIYKLIKWFRLMELKPNSWLVKWLVQPNRGDPTPPPSPKRLAKTYGVDLIGKVRGLDQAGIRSADGRIVPLEDLSVIWCTGFQAKFDFIEPLNRGAVFDSTGQPLHKRGLVASAPGLYFVGLRFQHTVGSNTIYGVGRDAEYVVKQIAAKGRV